MSAARPIVLVTCKQMQVELPCHAARIESAGYEVHAPQLRGQQFSAEELAPMMVGVAGMIAGDDDLNRSFFEASPDLRVLIRWGIGMDSVDHQAAADHRVTVRNTPGVFGREVADQAIGYMLALARGIPAVDAGVRRGEWPKFEGITLAGQRVGIVGAGAIGREIQKRAVAFGCDTVFADPYARQELLEAPLVPLEQLLATSRFVVLACPLSPETHHLLDDTRLDLVAPGSYVVNVARGPVIDEAALVRALDQGRLAGAGLDVFEVEPLPSDSGLRSRPNVVLGAHNASNTRQGVANASAAAVNFLLEELDA